MNMENNPKLPKLNLAKTVEQFNLQEDKNLYQILDSLETAEELAHSLALSIVSKKEELRKSAMSLLIEILAEYDLATIEIFNAWKSNAYFFQTKGKEKEELYTEENATEDFALIIKKNLLCIREIENKCKGACRFLYDNYGIRNFGRFSPETWIAQYEEREKQGAYGLIITSMDDWNASSYDEYSYQTYDNLRTQIHPSYRLRIMETQNLPKLARLLSRLKRFGQSPSFVIWSGHGNDQEFFLGPAEHEKITQKDFKGKAKEKINPYLNLFSPHTVMILDACSDDTTGNLPSIAAKMTGNNFIYPAGKTKIKDFGVKINSNGNLSFDVKYHFGVKTVTTG